MANERIRKGIDELKASGASSTADVSPAGALAAIAGTPTALIDLKENRAAAKTIRDAMIHVRKHVTSEIKAKGARISREHDELGCVPNENGVGRFDDMGPTKRRQYRDRALNKMERTVRGGVDEKVTEARVNAKALRETLATLEEAYASPLKLLHRTTLLDKDRATAQTILAGAGVHALNSAAEEAVRTGNRALAAAVTSALDHLPRGQRQLLRFSREEVAASVVREEFVAAEEQLTMSRYLLHMVEDLAHEVVTGKVDPDRKVRTGTLKMELAAKLGKTEAELDGDEGGQINER